MGMIAKFNDRLQAWGDRLDLMQEMFRRNGALPSAADSGEMRSAMKACLNCAHGEACVKWLAETPEGTPPPDFCANAFRIDRLRDTDKSIT